MRDGIDGTIALDTWSAGVSVEGTELGAWDKGVGVHGGVITDSAEGVVTEHSFFLDYNNYRTPSI